MYQQESFKIEIAGLVQGVGFRPFVYKQAKKLKIKGEVYNDGFGVIIKMNCTKKILNKFIKKIYKNLPPLARIDSLEVKNSNFLNYEKFIITSSKQNIKTTPLLSDFSICKACKKEFFDKKNPRFSYPFITCTHCGPRFSIIKNLPYDRKNTSMTNFKMCDFCKNEYEDPKNRRFHAQPLSCPKCKINTYLKDKKQEILANNKKAFKEVARLLRQGKIIAIKGMGGFHLMCDALNENALKELRLRKNRPLKPFALMCKNIKMAKKLALIKGAEKKALKSNISPIVILQKKLIKNDLIAPNSNKIGIMLAYTPLHLLLFKYFKNPLIATSANLSGESIIFNEEKLLEKLDKIFDFYLDYDRDIINSSDDSIVQIYDNKMQFLRTSRGVNPYYIDLKNNINKNILALGAELKNQFCIFYDKKLIISPYIGDLKNIDCYDRMKKLLDFFTTHYNLKFDYFLADKHPNFHYTKDFKNAVKISHHYAHFCATYFEFKLCNKALGFIFDGTGYGDDKQIWGGEIFYGDIKEYERITHFEYFKLINSDIKKISNLALSLIWHYNLENLASSFLNNFNNTNLQNLKKIYNNSTLTTSSLGRIIDGFTAILFNIQNLSFEAQMGLLLEKYYDKKLNFAYDFYIENGVINFKEAIKGALIHDKTKASTGFLNGLAKFIIQYSKNYDCEVILSGGVFQNKTLLEILTRLNFKFLTPLKFPCNDSSIALGQMVHFLHTLN
ncbi:MULTISPECIES: carbamoyltransferase HypF [unclassified Campylobacter]|uniref:carbamoyltransferase HypF n=1 Tax=unclassified Campylobacter TaxID=2593542 RepID=UPI001237D69D|nr:MULTISPECIES: carbamoyltransferase HypF [unclassified Campylobacter]KAA6225445.1 carbamoyltransferase HypF [Campylobacter sp. LR196d]KAA6228797.1 carbamoyltransferase HypF [Campylobacter sp. LR185c]KAA6229933.1 carbamoyltransferase HypF [Campylobacter sp. LR286c]KAA6234241.1 carbamoyltransferase HypF [Campylobacter sp. LR291e]KAA8604150.1 carbamoyltransferase HypF [Campylobacter sp. LR185c]